MKSWNHNHAPADYTCLFCCLVQKIDCDHNQLQQSDIVHQNEAVTAFMATRRFTNNEGHVLVIPNQHFENIFDLPLGLGAEIHAFSRTIALAMKANYHCDGILIRQHNEPAGGQHVWHHHLHVVPRYENDDFYNSEKHPFPAEKRAQFAQKLKTWIAQQT